MVNFIFLFFFVISIFFLNKYFVSKKILLSQSGEIHQKFASSNSVPLIGGIYLFILFSFIFFKIQAFSQIIFLTLFFLLGILVDLKKIISPKKRLILQTVILIILVYYSQLEIINTRVEFFDTIIKSKIINFCFVIFCLLILINGSNFIDGLNGLLVGYYLVITLALLKINFFNFYQFDTELNLILILTLITIYLFNISNKLFLGDNGVYIISLSFGYMIINFHQNFPQISPYFFIMLLWYPCFENLFSIIRKSKLKKSPINPDTNHLHQLLFYFLKKNNSYNDLFNNNFSSLIIILMNLIFFMIATINVYSTNLQLLTIFSSILTYIFFYILLFNYKYKIKR